MAQTKYKPIKFPKDESTHNHMIEWWYFNGHLKDKKGNHYSFMDCLFRVNVHKLNIPFAKKAPFRNFYFAHSIISDIGKKKIYPNVKNIVIVSKDSFTKPLLFVNYTEPFMVKGYGNSAIEEIRPFSYHVKNDNLDLNLESTKKPLLENGKGFTDICGNKSFYYSLTNLKAGGVIKISGKNAEVSGKAWMDHQWTNSSGYYEDRWNWFSIQLDNNMEIMCNEYISGDKRDYMANVVYPDGKQEWFKKVVMTPAKTWQSKKTKEKYPLSWRIEIPEIKIKLNTAVFMKNHEMPAALSKYWEGPIKISGTFKGKRVKGVGFMELVKQISPYNKHFFKHG